MDINDFLDYLHATVSQVQATSSTESVDVAYLGNVLAKGEHRYTDHFSRLSEALAQLQQTGRVELFHNTQDALHVRAAGGSTAPGAHVQPIALPAPQPRFRPLLPPVWLAFTTPLPQDRQRLINRRTGAVFGGAGAPPSSQEDWLPVAPVPDDEQRGWAAEFLDAEISDDDDKGNLRNALESPDWFRQFPAHLDDHQRRAWNRWRSERVVTRVKSWARGHHVADTILFGAGTATGVPQPPTTNSAVELRRALLAALAKVSTEDLLALPIQARLVVEAVRPDLLKRS